MNDKIQVTIDYYTLKSKEIVDYINTNQQLSVEDIISSGEQLAVLEYKITALEVAKEN